MMVEVYKAKLRLREWLYQPFPRYLEDGHGGNIIQGSVSLEDEGIDGCTELVHGFQHHIAEWWDKIVSRGTTTDGLVHEMEKLWTHRYLT